MADNRVLNFSEFGKKYNQESEQDIAASYADFSNAADNFQEGFDEDTYEDGQAGPKRPLAQGEEATPAQPGEEGAPAFKSETEGMEAPEEEEAEEEVDADDVEAEIDAEIEAEEAPEEEEAEDEDYGSGNPEEGEDEEEDEEEEDEEEEEANESKMTTNNRVNRNMIILESFDQFETGTRNVPYSSQPKRLGGYDEVLDTIELDFDDSEEEQDDSCFVTCKSCGAKKEVEPGSYPMGASNISNPDSWWQGAKLGMQCGCK